MSDDGSLTWSMIKPAMRVEITMDYGTVIAGVITEKYWPTITLDGRFDLRCEHVDSVRLLEPAPVEYRVGQLAYITWQHVDCSGGRELGTWDGNGWRTLPDRMRFVDSNSVKITKVEPARVVDADAIVLPADAAKADVLRSAAKILGGKGFCCQADACLAVAAAVESRTGGEGS